MNILITGGLGYIGGRLASFLKESSKELNIYLTNEKKDIVPPDWAKEFKILYMDVIDETSIDLCMKNDIDVIIHLAAVNEIDSFDNPELAIEVNTTGTYKVLKYASKNNIKKFIYFSTFHIYGHPQSSLINEETPPKPFHPYAITHLSAENFVRFFKHYHNMQTLIVRLSNGYGYPMDKNVNRWTLVFNDLCRQAVTQRKMVIKSRGQYRDFISLSNIARAIYHFIFNIPEKWGDGLFNLGGSCCISILEAAERIADVYKSIYNKEIKIDIETKGDNDKLSNSFKYDINKLLNTGFQLEDNMDIEIRKTLMLCQEFCK